jgi:hypothetical protein
MDIDLVRGIPRRRWEDGIRMDLRETGFYWLRIGTGGEM